MKTTRRTFLQHASLLATTMPLVNRGLSSAEPIGVGGSARPGGGLRRDVLFSPGNLTERRNAYDRFELLKKSDRNPVMTAEMRWEQSGIGWGSVLRSLKDGKFKLFYGTEFAGAQEGAVLVDNSMQGKKHCVVCYAESDDGLAWRRPAVVTIQHNASL